MRILEIDEINTVPLVPLSHPFVDRLIGTMRREFLDHVLFWNACDLERKLADFQMYYNVARSHASLDGRTPLTFASGHTVAQPIWLDSGHSFAAFCGRVQGATRAGLF